MSWRELAACKDADTDLFFPKSGGKATKARQFCEQCPVVVECLDYALRTNSSTNDWGIWGGTNAPKRKKLRAQLRRDEELIA